MSALTNPTPLPSPVQKPPQRVLPTPVEPPPQKSRWKGLLILGFLAAAGITAWQLWLKPAQQKPATPIVVARTAKVVTGSFVRTLRLGGVTSAREFAHVTAPRPQGPESRGQMELLKLVKDGAWVKKGETIVEIDPGYLVDHVDDIKATILQANLDVDRRKAEQSVETDTLNQNVRVAKSELDKANLENSASEVRTDIERELLKLSVEEADARHKQVQLDLPQKAAVHGSELKILGFTMERHTRHLGRHTKDIQAFTVFAPMEGMAVVQSTYRGGGESYKVQQGDQVGPGQAILRVVNPKSMQVEATANQSESSEVRIGQKAIIGFDAFPGMTLTGKVYSIGALAIGGWRQNFYIRNVPLKLTIDGVDPRLIPDLSASADIVLEEKDNAILVPLGAVHQESGRSYVYVKEGEQFMRRDVSLGPANNMSVVAVSGVKPGDEVRMD